jgi:hypothetical protein
MSEKIIDFKDLRKLIRPSVDKTDRRLIEMRLEQEEADETRENSQKAVIDGAPPIPDAELVFCHATQSTGVAVRGAKRICPLPKGYGGRELSLALIPGDRLIAIQPGRPTLVIDPQTGTTRRL